MGTYVTMLKMLLMLLAIHSVALLSCSQINPNVGCIKSERDALLKFRHSLHDPDNMLSSWIGEDCCSWMGVSCNNATGHVMKLDLRVSGLPGLTGQLSPTLLDLPHLEYLDLSMNTFDIKIPIFLCSLESLKYLNISNAGFLGNIPHHLGNLSKLEYLDLSFNFLIVDSFRWVSTLSALKYLDLSFLNAPNASDWLRSINMLPSLVELHLVRCNLHAIPLSFYANFTHLKLLDLGYNNFDCSLPYWIFNISNLEYLDLAVNDFQGAIPLQIGNQKFLRFLDLSDNELEGNIPGALCSLCNLQELHLQQNKFNGDVSESLGNASGCIENTLKILDLGENYFSGKFADLLGQFKPLEFIDLSFNSFTGPISTSIGSLSNLRELYLSSNNLSGPIPISFGQLSSLEVLDVSDNSLEGAISELHFARLKSLISLNMGSNSLVFNVSPSWLPPFTVEFVSLSSCKVGPQFPKWLKSQKNIHYLDMSNTIISDSIPTWFENLSSSIGHLDLSHNKITKNLPRLKIMSYVSGRTIIRKIKLQYNKLDGPLVPFPSDVDMLDLSNNFLSGQIPQTFFSEMQSLGVLSLSNNQLNGSIPDSACNIVSLAILDLSKNHLTDELPQCWEKMEELFVLDLSNNNLTGRLPVTLGSLRNLNSLHLQHNNLHGNIPSSLRKIELLSVLDLSENCLTGSIPSWIGESLIGLNVLNLEANKFTGEIPSQLCQLGSLTILHLGKNMLNGNIPRCFGNLTAMSIEMLPYFEYPSENDYKYDENVKAYVKGKELQYTKTARFLVSFDLSRNNFVGEIPKELMRLSVLKNLNLSDNKLKGHIPSEIGKLKQLESLDLSRNELSGSIPSTISALNFLSYLNLSFNNLSGRIPGGNQLQTLANKSIYMGNDGLCGPPLKTCPEDELPSRHHENMEKATEGDSARPWFYCGLAMGFLTGFVGVCSILYFKNSWRYAWFKLVDIICLKLSVTAAVMANQLRRKLKMENEI